MKIEGKVILLVDVAESGTVNKVSVAETSGNESLDRSAVDAVKGWKFTPARKNGVIVSQVVRVPITFSLKNR
jgi:protein TonB